MKPALNHRIRIARENKELDQKTLAKNVHVAIRTLQRWEKGVQAPNGHDIVKLAAQTGVRPEWLLTGNGGMHAESVSPSKIIPFKKDRLLKDIVLVNIPVLSSVPAGKANAMYYTEHAERYVTVDDIRDRNAFALIVKGDSMSPKIEDGDIVVISPSAEVRSGDICVIRINEEDVLKKIKIEERHVHLIPLNPNFDSVCLHKRDITFIWKVAKVIKNL